MVYYSKELYHHGILGMKWGVRRYQNYDGSYTQAGVKRYQSAQSNYESAKENKKKQNLRIRKARQVKRSIRRLQVT